MRGIQGLSLLASLAGSVAANGPISAEGNNFTLTGDNVSYLFHVDNESGDLVHDHFGGPSDGFRPAETLFQGGWVDGLSDTRREFPDIGRSDYRLPAIHIRHADGDTVSAFYYKSHEIVEGKPEIPGLPATFGEKGDVSTLMVNLYDNYSDISATLSYSIFPKYNAIARHFELCNNGSSEIVLERAASFSVDLPNLDLDMIELQGDWAHEMNRVKRTIDFGETSFRSTMGYSSHQHNPFFALVSPTTTETTGEAWGFNLVYTGSFAATASRFSNGFVRVLMGLNELHSSLHLKAGETFTSPEVVSVYSSEGLGGMSRSYHDLYRNHLSRSQNTFKPRPVLLNSWEGVYFDYNQTSIEKIAEETAALGISLFVNDDGWFGTTPDARINDTAGLGDWTPNPDRFPEGLTPYVDTVTNYTVANTSKPLKFGIWVEPEMVNQNSTLYKEHPDWALHAGKHPRTVTRHQLVLNMGLPEVQKYVIDAMSKILDSGDISYVKWDNNRGIHEMSMPSDDHKYMLGMYHVIDTLTTKYPEVLWEGCASGGGRFDAGLLHYWPQSWTSDNTDAPSRLNIQLGTSLAYPLSAMACHVSAIPNGNTGRNVTIEYRAHVAMWCGSFGFELDPGHLEESDRLAIPGIIADHDKVQPLVLNGTFYRLALPAESNWPGVQLISADKETSAVFAFQQMATVKPAPPPFKLQGLDPKANYWNSVTNQTYSGATYMNAGLNLAWEAMDYQSQLIWLYKK